MANQNPYPQGTLGVQTPANGQTTTSGGWGGAFLGIGGQTSGGQFGADPGANNYAQQASALGAGNANYDTHMGGYNASMLSNQGGTVNDTFQNLGNGYAKTATPPVNYGQANQALGNQQQAMSLYQGAANGTGPSAAQAQLQAGVGQSIQAQQAAAASSRGGFGLANAQHDAAGQAGQLQATAGNNAAQLRAQEQQAGMAGYANTAGTIQQQQAQNAQYNAGLAQNQGQMNAQNQLAAYGQGAQTDLAYQNAAQQAQLGWTQAGQGNALSYNQLGAGVQSNQLSADVANEQARDQLSASNASNAQKGLGAAFSGIGSVANSGSSLLESFMSDENAKMGVTSASTPSAAPASAPASTPSSSGGGGGGDSSGLASLGAGLSGQPPPSSGGGGGGGGGGMMKSMMGSGGGASMLAMMSDEHAKSHIDGGMAPADRVLDSLQPYTYAYKDPGNEPRPDPNGHHYLGVMAQDLEKTPEGAQAVEQGPDGAKRVNTNAALSIALAGVGRLHERISALEASMGKHK